MIFQAHRTQLLPAFWLAISPMAQAQTIDYFQHFTTPAIESATAVAADSSSVYVFGNKGSDIASVRKYDSGGKELWMRTISPPAIGTLHAVTGSDGVYMLAFAGTDGQRVLRKYSPAGDELWTLLLGVPFSPGAIAVDASGVYVTGGNYQSAFVRKYSPDGSELWTRQFGEIQTATGVAADSTGVYVQITYSNGAAGVVVRKYDSAGNELWTRQLNPADVYRSLTAAIPTGFYITAADAWGSGTYLRRYDLDGNEMWSRHPSSSPDLGRTTAVDKSGVYLAGQVPPQYTPYQPYAALPGQCRSASGGDSFVRKYDPDGVELWTRQFGTTDATWATDVAVNDSGVFVVGSEGTALVQADTEHFDSFVPAHPTANAFLAKFEKGTPEDNEPRPRIFPDCVVNAASYVGGGLAPGEMVTIFGARMGPPEPVTSAVTGNRLATILAGARVLFNGIPAPLLYVSEKQAGAIVPYGVAGHASVDVEVEYNGTRSEPVSLPVLASRPGIFSLDGSGQGQGAILNEDGSFNAPSNPATRGSIITLYATGGGEAAAGIEDGQMLGGLLPQTSLPVSVFFDLPDNEFPVPTKSAEVLYAGGVSGSVAGLLQIRLRVPANVVAIGKAVPFLLIIGSHWTLYQATAALR